MAIDPGYESWEQKAYNIAHAAIPPNAKHIHVPDESDTHLWWIDARGNRHVAIPSYREYDVYEFENPCNCGTCYEIQREMRSVDRAKADRQYLRSAAVDLVKQHVYHAQASMTRPTHAIDANSVVQLLQEFALRQLCSAEEKYYQRLHRMRLTHNADMKQAMVGLPTTRESNSKMTVPNTDGRMFKEGEYGV